MVGNFQICPPARYSTKSDDIGNDHSNVNFSQRFTKFFGDKPLLEQKLFHGAPK